MVVICPTTRLFLVFVIAKFHDIIPESDDTIVRKDESASSFEARANLLMKYFGTIRRETSATTMPEYTESRSFDLKICRDEISQIARKLVISIEQGPDMLSLLDSMLALQRLS